MLSSLLQYVLLFPLYFFLAHLLVGQLRSGEEKRTIPEVLMITIAYSISSLVCEPSLLLLISNTTLGALTDLYFIPKIRKERHTGVA